MTICVGPNGYANLDKALIMRFPKPSFIERGNLTESGCAILTGLKSPRGAW